MGVGGGGIGFEFEVMIWLVLFAPVVDILNSWIFLYLNPTLCSWVTFFFKGCSCCFWCTVDLVWYHPVKDFHFLCLKETALFFFISSFVIFLSFWLKV